MICITIDNGSINTVKEVIITKDICVENTFTNFCLAAYLRYGLDLRKLERVDQTCGGVDLKSVLKPTELIFLPEGEQREPIAEEPVTIKPIDDAPIHELETQDMYEEPLYQSEGGDEESQLLRSNHVRMHPRYI